MACRDLPVRQPRHGIPAQVAAQEDDGLQGSVCCLLGVRKPSFKQGPVFELDRRLEFVGRPVKRRQAKAQGRPRQPVRTSGNMRKLAVGEEFPDRSKAVLDRRLKAGKKLQVAVKDLLTKLIKENKQIIFNGNNYADSWQKEAAKRGLLNHKTSVDAYGEVLDLLPEFRKLAKDAGRDPATIPITVFGVADDGDLIKRYRDAGVARIIFNVPPAKADEVLPLLGRGAALIRQAA